jgi:hypothetical protein
MATKKKTAPKAEDKSEADLSQVPAVRPQAPHPTIQGDRELTVDEMVYQLDKIHDLQKRVMKEGIHYGKIEGIDKPTLYQPGAQTLLLTFKLDPQFEHVRDVEGDHLTIYSKCTIWSTVTGKRLGSADASCSSRESRFSLRQGSRKCPNCGKESIIKGKAEYGGGFICWQKKDGCGAKFRDNDPQIVGQSTEMVEIPNVRDTWNAVIKQANIRALRSAVLNVTAASDIFTVDMGPDDRGDIEATASSRDPYVRETELSKADQGGVEKFVDETADKGSYDQQRWKQRAPQQHEVPPSKAVPEKQQGVLKKYPITEKHKTLRAELIDFVKTYKQAVATELDMPLSGDEKKDVAELAKATLKQFTAFGEGEKRFPGRESIENLSEKQVTMAIHTLHDTIKSIQAQQQLAR